jgi:RHS repeat-associated protein
VSHDKNATRERTTLTRGLDLSGTLKRAGDTGGLLVCTVWNGSNWPCDAFYHADGNGNITYLLLPAGTPGASYRYDPYGRILGAPGGSLGSANRMRFSSKLWVPFSGGGASFSDTQGLYYYGYRFYSPLMQRWISRDPIEEEGGINVYAFAEGDPIGSFDSLGHAGSPAGSCLLNPEAMRLAAELAIEAGEAAAPAAAAVGRAAAAAALLGSIPHERETEGRLATQGAGRGNPGERKQQGKSPNEEKTRGKPDNHTGKKPKDTEPEAQPAKPKQPKEEKNKQDEWWKRWPGNQNPPKDNCPPRPGLGR